MFSHAHRAACASKGVDIEDSYAALLLDIRFGGPVMQRLCHALQGNPRRNSPNRRVTPTARELRVTSVAVNRGAVRKLPPSQLDVLAHYAAGNTSREIAWHRGTGLETVRTQAKQLREALGARSAAHAVAIALREGVLTDEIIEARTHRSRRSLAAVPAGRAA